MRIANRMKQNPTTRRAFALSFIAIIAILATSGLVFGAEKAKTMSAPDLTTGNNRHAFDRKFTYNLGPTGMRGGIWTQWSTYNSNTSTADKPWQILVTSVGKDTPAAAAGILPNDVPPPPPPRAARPRVSLPSRGSPRPSRRRTARQR